MTTAANVNDITQALALVDGIPPVAGRPGHPRRRPDALLGDKAYDLRAVSLACSLICWRRLKRCGSSPDQSSINREHA
ncbi:hypothetical protein [Streptomyces sp. NPDC001340]